MPDQNDPKNLLYLKCGVEISEILLEFHVYKFWHEICAIRKWILRKKSKFEEFICAARKALGSFSSPRHDYTGNNNSYQGFSHVVDAQPIIFRLILTNTNFLKPASSIFLVESNIGFALPLRPFDFGRQ